jgi:succinate dehydrogenase / fumarate reductase, cytochrome b subunit
MHRNPARPLSPHLTIWKWGPHMAASIINRVTGVGLAVLGGALFTWWLVALASGPEAYRSFVEWTTWKWFLVIWIGLTWAMLQHAFAGLRHFVLDIGAGFELRRNRFWAIVVLIAPIAFTGIIWTLIFLRIFQ